MNEDVNKFKEGIFSLNTRRFGKIAELMIQELYGFKDSKSNAYDLLADDGRRIEVKFSTVLKKCNDSITKDNAIEEILKSKINNRMMKFGETGDNTFDCNIQQVKTKEFETLYYGCFFEDQIMICKIESKQIIDKENHINYSDRQHRYNKGEGQFHINNKTIEEHLEKYLVDWLTYEQLYDLFL